ncbi:MAG: hypothetical protein WD604_07280 [Balneolaceae bacterium]
MGNFKEIISYFILPFDNLLSFNRLINSDMAKSLYLFIFIFFYLTGAAVTAQDTQPDPTQSLLPEINPQDIEIRSQFQARFPGLRRQPILGFNPTPRVYQVDPNRMPFIEDEETVMANLPIGDLDRSAPPVYEPLGYKSPQNGFARMGIGSFITPEADVYGIAKLGDNNWVSGNFNFTSTHGHLENHRSSYRFMDADIRSFSKLSDRASLRLNAGAESGFNHFPELDAGSADMEDPATRVEVTGFHGGADLAIARNSVAGFNLAVQGYANEFDMSSRRAMFEGGANEWGVNAKAEYSRLGNNIDEVHRIRAQSRVGASDFAGFETSNWSVSHLSAHYERLFNYKTDVKAKLGVSAVTDAFADISFYLSPRLRVNHTLFDGFDIRGEISGAPKHASIHDIYQENRFIDYSSQLRHQYEGQLSGEVELEPFMGTKLIGGASFQTVSNYLYYSRNSFIEAGIGTVNSYYDINFEDATFMKLYAGFSQELNPQVFWISADGYWQRPRLSGNEKIPFTESYSIKGTLSYRPVKQVVFEGWSEYTGSRENSLGDELSSYIQLGGRFEISITEQAGVYGKLVNLLNQEYELWQGYPERGFQAFVGFTYLF